MISINSVLFKSFQDECFLTSLLAFCMLALRWWLEIMLRKLFLMIKNHLKDREQDLINLVDIPLVVVEGLEIVSMVNNAFLSLVGGVKEDVVDQNVNSISPELHKIGGEYSSTIHHHQTNEIIPIKFVSKSIIMNTGPMKVVTINSEAALQECKLNYSKSQLREERFSDVLMEASLGLCRVDLLGYINFISKQAVDLLDAFDETSELIGYDFSKLLRSEKEIKTFKRNLTKKGVMKMSIQIAWKYLELVLTPSGSNEITIVVKNVSSEVGANQSIQRTISFIVNGMTLPFNDLYLKVGETIKTLDTLASHDVKLASLEDFQGIQSDMEESKSNCVLINDFLFSIQKFEKLQSGRTNISSKSFSVVTLIENIGKILKGKLEEFQVSMVISIEDTILNLKENQVAIVMGDESKTFQIISHVFEIIFEKT